MHVDDGIGQLFRKKMRNDSLAHKGIFTSVCMMNVGDCLAFDHQGSVFSVSISKKIFGNLGLGILE